MVRAEGKMTSLAAQKIVERLIIEKYLDEAWTLDMLDAQSIAPGNNGVATAITVSLDGCRVHMLIWNETGLAR